MARLMLDNWLLRALVNLLVFASMPFIAWATYVADQKWEVIGDMRITEQIITPEGVMIYGTMNKDRACRFIEAVSVAGDGAVTPIRYPTRPRDNPTITRPLGEQRFGPWILDVKKGERATIYARHVCHFAWEHGEMLTTFIVGRDTPN